MREPSQRRLYRSISRTLCLLLLVETSGFGTSWALVPKPELLTREELEARRAGIEPEPDFVERVGRHLAVLGESVSETFSGALVDLAGAFIQTLWEAEPLQVASLGDPPALAQPGEPETPPAPAIPSDVLTDDVKPKDARPAPGHSPPKRPSLPERRAVPPPPTLPPSAVVPAKASDLPLVAGFNLVSLPDEPTDPDPATVLASIAGQYSAVFAYDACDAADPWKLFDPNDPAASDLLAIDHRSGFWIEATTPLTLPSAGSQPPVSELELCAGWNLIGYPLAQPRPVLAALWSIREQLVRVFGFDAADAADPWEVWSAEVPDWANDLERMQPGRGYWVLVSEDVTLRFANQGPPPEVAIAAPLDLGEVAAPSAVTGSVVSELLESWELRYRPVGDGEPVVFASGDVPVAGDVLGTFDPTLLLNGLYEITLTATDFAGVSITESLSVAVDGQMKIGHFTLSFVDLAIPLSGLDVEIVRTYDSRDKQPRDFGVGWTLDVRQGSYRNNRPPGDGWEFETGFLPCDTILERKSHLTVVRLSDQEVYRFALRLGSAVPEIGGCVARARFDFVDGPLPGTTLEILGNDLVFWGNGSDQVIDQDTLAVFEPRDVRLTTRDGRIFELDLVNGVERVEDLNGNQLTITPAGITHSNGRGIAFERDAEGRIEKITDPLGQSMSYGYDLRGDLVSFTDREANVTRFFYDDAHRVRDIEDPRGIQPIRNDYDEEGRWIRTTDAFGKSVQFEHDLDGRREVITNRLGHVRVLEYDERGNVVREVDENQKVTLREFDSEDNLLKETDPLLNTTEYFYDANNDLLRIVDPEQKETRFTYNTRGQILTLTDPRGKVTTNRYDPQGNLELTRDPTDAETVFTYFPAGNLRTQTDAEQTVTTFEYDPFGRQTKVIDALGHATESTHDANGNVLTETTTRTLPDGTVETLTTRFEYDALDRLKKTIFPDSSVTETRYDALGKVRESIDQLQRSTVFQYNLMGQLELTQYPDSTEEVRTYDAEGQLKIQKDRGDRLTTFDYDPVGRLIRTTFADDAFTINRYDDAGRLIEFEDGRRNITRYFYDKAGRRTKIIDALDGVTDFEYDDAGNQTAIVDPKRKRTEFKYDDANRLVRTIFPNLTERQVAYDALGRRISETDQAGKVTQFEYDELGRLTKVTDALLQETEYVYDELGNRIQQIDANGHVTRFEYDRLARQTARILPDGSRESMVYNDDGTVASHTDFNGATRTFEYDSAQRVLRRAYPDDSEVTFTYTDTGQRATATDARGITRYFYDDRDRLTDKIDPTGSKLGYVYDLQGNLTDLTATVDESSFATSYTYDALNRLEKIIDPEGWVTTHRYDPNGNREGLDHANGLTTSYAYDDLNRLTGLETRDASSNVTQSYAYTLAPTGHRTRIDEADGTVRSYVYDDLYRLTQDRVTDVAGAQIYQRDFVYDPVGNRRTQTIEEGAGPSVVSSTYDERDRLLTAGGTSYGWDKNGSLTSRDQTALTWDFEQRLTSVTLGDGTLVETIYDVDGNRVRTTVSPPGGPAVSVDYLVDTRGFLSHVVAEVVAGAVETIYVRSNDELISLYRPRSGEARWFHADGLGSVRLLTDEVGGVTDRYSYTAFGKLLGHTGTDLNPYRFAGESFDANIGFYYNRARWLDVANGRFVSVDLFAGATGEPQSLHRYLYVSNEPIGTTDPTGLFGADGLAGLGISSAIVGIIGAIASVAVNGLINKLVGARFLDGAAGAAAFGAAALPLSLAFPIVGVVLAGLGIVGAGTVAWRVFTSSASSPTQKAGAIFLVGLSLFGAYATSGIAAKGGLWINVGFLRGGLASGTMSRGLATAARRAGEFEEALLTLPQQQQNSITMAVGRAVDSSGRVRTLIATSEPRGYIRGPLRSLIRPDDVIVRGTGHAEADIVSYCRTEGWRLIAIGATRDICPSCAAEIASAGANVATPLQ